MRKKLIVINGVMGVGKTTVSKALYEELENSFWLDGDNCWMMNPFQVTEENKKMVIDNISYILNNFINNSKSNYIIFNWVIHTDEIMSHILEKLNLNNVELYKITLMCAKDILINRINKDIRNDLRDNENIYRSLEKFELYNKMDTIKIDTSNKNISDILCEIKTIIL